MKIERDITATLERWKNSVQRKPLILQGARQTGKTWVMSVFHSKFATALRIRFSMNNLKQDDGFINIPVFMADWTNRIINLVS